MPKQTAKRVAAEKLVRETFAHVGNDSRYVANFSNDELYQSLADNHYIWNSKKGTWEKGSTSMFKDADDQPTGVVRLRVMAHPDDCGRAIALLKKKLGKDAVLTEVSDPYENRKGAGVRVYSTLVLK
jgi:hypothetical protein